jgi:hypothetical protein
MRMIVIKFSNPVRRVYLFSFFWAALLFIFHSFILIETGAFLMDWKSDANLWLGPRLAGPALVIVAFFLLFITHMIEALAWGLFFQRLGQFRNLEEATYFTGTSLTALGYGDLVLRPPWQRLGPVMATNGILMYGCSTAFLFLVIQKAWEKAL